LERLPGCVVRAHKWRALVLSDIVAESNCGIGQDRGMLTVYGKSITDLMALAQSVLEQRTRFRRRVDGVDRRAKASQVDQPTQQSFTFGELAETEPEGH
jgi:hypothetical protein